MKICFITTGDIKDIATSKRALGMASFMAELAWDVHIIMEDAEENRLRVGLECTSSVTVHYFEKCNPFEERKIKKQLLGQIKPDFVYICAFVFRNIVRFRDAYTLVEHSELQSGMDENKKLAYLKTLFIEYYSIMYADGLLLASKYLEKVFNKRKKKLFKNNQPNLYFPYAYHPEIYSKSQNRSASGSKHQYEGKFVIVYIGSMAENYGLFTMLEACKMLKTEKLNVKLLLLGKGSHYKEGLEYVAKNTLEDVVEMLGYVDEEDVPAFFEQGDAFLSPLNNTVQDWARCPSKLYMYLPYNKPVITCKIGEPYEVLKETGIYYESGDSQSLCQAIKALVTEKRPVEMFDSSQHSWKQRSQDFHDWVLNAFPKKKVK